MSEIKIKSNEHIVEQIIRNLTKIEDNLEFVDSYIPALPGANRMVDILAIDKSNRLVTIFARYEPQNIKTNKGTHILKESVSLWDWVVELRDVYVESAKHLTGKKIALIPPRLFLIAPSFDTAIISLVNTISIRIDAELFTFNPDNFYNDELFTKVNLDKIRKASQGNIKQLNDFTDEVIQSLRKLYKPTNLHHQTAYEPFKLDDLLKNLTPQKRKEHLDNINKKIKENNLSIKVEKNQVVLKNEFGKVEDIITIKSSGNDDIN